jgi:hypothetical protein
MSVLEGPKKADVPYDYAFGSLSSEIGEAGESALAWSVTTQRHFPLTIPRTPHSALKGSIESKETGRQRQRGTID